MFRFLRKQSRAEKDLLMEEAVQTPAKMVLNNFLEKRTAVIGLTVFLLIFACVLIGPIFYPISLDDKETTQTDVPPGLKMLDVPDQLNGNVRQIATGATFSVGVDNDGNVYAWGHTKISNTIDIAEKIPSREEMGNVISVAAGYDHAMALNDRGEVFCWGNGRLGQCKIPSTLKREKIVQIACGYQMSFALSEDGEVFYWGNENFNDIRVTKKKENGNIRKIAVCNMTLIALTKDGKVVHMGGKSADIAAIPENMGIVVDIAASSDSCIAVTETGELYTWGQCSNGQGNPPEIEGTPVSVFGGRYHFTLLTDTGKVYSWGSNAKRQLNVPENMEDTVAIYGGYYQNYAVDEEGNVTTWGLKGYLMGTDDLGRDMFARLLSGGRMTMTVGGISVIISIILGILIGGISGFFGGWIDLLLQRFAEVVDALPFMPMAMILTAMIGNSMTENARIVLIMVILGFLNWPSLARLVRAQVLAEREKEFVLAATAMGVKKMAIVFRHIIPNVISAIIVSATLSFASCMLIESSLSYLGFGVKLPRPTWGNMLNGCVSSVVIQNCWWRWVFPTVMLSVCVICINMVGDGLRDAIDPKSNEQ